MKINAILYAYSVLRHQFLFLKQSDFYVRTLYFHVTTLYFEMCFKEIMQHLCNKPYNDLASIWQ